ncbi:hypothetical protein D8Y22_15650 [Salinadaptatus halalkaliphilus]|uniref:Uncharacterized protein n=2 Tax=Salinadaptatus halalkaliphilus TaxID=2419781 RepID=A0A4S3TLD0_9EURY|nr:hypothetical protein D8Y22_15650 [Salinadaptatus halalkaliphilus]
MSAPQRVEFFLNASTAVPRTWTFIDFIVLADGRRYARVWDASQYPSLYTYVDGTLRKKEDMDYEPKQLWNRSMFAFHMRASAGATPYNIAPLTQFQAMLRTGPDADLWNQYRERIEETLEALEIGWSASELLPTTPRVTVGFDADGEPIDDPDAPFPPAEALIVPVADTLPPN